ncbi:hypothetical protein LTR85_007635 [Meristemomyces frigidus]|nr:hypothetical protein LTR85_007635 [Meristemomyces frigidus]
MVPIRNLDRISMKVPSTSVCRSLLFITDKASTETKPLTVIVAEGDSTATFYIAEQAAKTHSDFFTAALPLPDVCKFVLSGKIFSRKEGDTRPIGDELLDCEWGRLSDCWLLGDKLGSDSFQDAVVDTICQKLEAGEWFPLGLHRKAFRDTAAANGMRRLAVDDSVWKFTSKHVAGLQEGPWNTFFHDLAVRLHELSDTDREGKPPFIGETCQYH